MGYRELDLDLPLEYNDTDIKKGIKKACGISDGRYKLVRKSLDARKKDRIVWSCTLAVYDKSLKGTEPQEPRLKAEKKARKGPVVVVGTGPAGIFSADYLSRSGFEVHVLERGSRVETRREAIQTFEKGGDFPHKNNYSFGEGGAGTFSDGKLSSRSKGINLEKSWIYEAFLEAGAPEEISWLTHPHLGSDVLFDMTIKLRHRLENQGVHFHFDTLAKNLLQKDGLISAVETDDGSHLEARALVFACGHSASETQRMLMDCGVPFQVKNFALGMRAEHSQELINKAQWGRVSLPGVKAAEYRLSSQYTDGTGVYTFCMCPGGVVVPASAYAESNIVNGMSLYKRDGHFANAAVVAAVNVETLLGRSIDAREALTWLETLEGQFYTAAGGYKAPAMRISDFLEGRSGSGLGPSSHPLGLVEANLRELLPSALLPALTAGLSDFCRKLRGYEEGQLLGLESKTSAPIQVKRDPENLCSGFANLYIAGEGAGWSGGIISSAADGLRVAQALAKVW